MSAEVVDNLAVSEHPPRANIPWVLEDQQMTKHTDHQGILDSLDSLDGMDRMDKQQDSQDKEQDSQQLGKQDCDIHLKQRNNVCSMSIHSLYFID